MTETPPPTEPKKASAIVLPASSALPSRSLPKVLRKFLHTESSGGIVLLLAAAVALIWANSPASASYHALWETELTLDIGGVSRHMDLRHFVNEALMALFFFVVGLEIKRELVAGELRTWQRAALPAFAAVGGMVVPAALYLLINSGAPGSRGWGVPMATDIAFAVGVMALLGPRAPATLKIFLLTLAIVDDIGAILVIALVYSGSVNLYGLGVAVGVVALIAVMRYFRVEWMPVFIVCGVVVWIAVYESGVHATIAGVVLGLLTPARPMAAADMARQWAADLADEPTIDELNAMTTVAKASVSVAERLEHSLHPVTSFMIIPLFALANAGVTLEGGSLDAPGAKQVVAGVVVGLVLGKIVGISAFSWLALRLGVGEMPEGIRARQLVGAAAVAGIGFTVSLFIASLAFESPDLEAAAKIGILIASALASGIGYLVLRSAPPPAPLEVTPEQSARHL